MERGCPIIDRDDLPMNSDPPIVSSATFLIFDPGLYAIEFRGAGEAVAGTGLPLPCARLEPVAAPGHPGRCSVSTLPEGGWLSRHTIAAHVLVVGGQAGAVLTLYQPGDAAALPQVQFRALLTPEPPPPPAAGAALLVHLEGQGDRTGAAGEWLGDLEGVLCIEGFSITPPPGMEAAGLEYQGIMGADWRTPWFPAGAFCGSRGLRLPLLGFRLRLAGTGFACQASGSFAGGGVVGPVGSEEDCAAEQRPLTAMRVELTAKPR